MITQEILQQITPKANPDFLAELADGMNEAFDQYGIDTPLRQAHFLAQAAHESGGFRTLVENLNYSADGLLRTFRKYFTPANVGGYARQPEKIANRVYGGRMGNGPESSGDGWRYRGRGIFQITGKDNYNILGKILGMDLVSDPDMVLEPINAVYTACAYWDRRGLNEDADDDDLLTITKKINGGTNGLDERGVYLKRAKAALGV